MLRLIDRLLFSESFLSYHLHRLRLLIPESSRNSDFFFPFLTPVDLLSRISHKHNLKPMFVLVCSIRISCDKISVSFLPHTFVYIVTLNALLKLGVIAVYLDNLHTDVC
jgi:hypothetical protein